MEVRALKYGMVYSIPVLFIAGLFSGGWLTFAPLLFAFGVIPLLELIYTPDVNNVDAAEREMRLLDHKYDLMLYTVVPIVYGCVASYLYFISREVYSISELTGLTLSLGVVLGGLGINVAHELGHRPGKFEQFLSKALLMPSGYMHFFIEHNRGHHKNVSTFEDPASARYKESLYHFWIRSVVYSYISSWNIEKQRLERAGKSVLNFRNEMLQFQMIQMFVWLLLLYLFGWKITLLYTCAAVAGFLLLETVNYIEHYGLQRTKVNEHRYEKVTPIHSWNSNHVVGRIMLFELSRHSDHHYQPAKKYQVLDHHEHSPQMPTGYPGMMLLSLVPPLWFYIMNPKVNGQKTIGASEVNIG
jgi:alkane 1-monooxygenase